MMLSAKLPFLARLGIHRISSEKQETMLKLLALSTAAILCKPARPLSRARSLVSENPFPVSP